MVFAIQKKHSSGRLTNDDAVALCRRCAKGDEHAKRRIVELLLKRIHRTVSFLAANREDAKDIAQIACIEVVQSAGSFEGRSSLEYWADRITVQAVAKVLEKRDRRRTLFCRFAGFFNEQPDVDVLCDAVKMRKRVADLLASMKYDQREVLVLRYVHEYTCSEIADMIDAPIETVRSRVKIGRAVLKKKMMHDAILKDWVEP